MLNEKGGLPFPSPDPATSSLSSVQGSSLRRKILGRLLGAAVLIYFCLSFFQPHGNTNISHPYNRDHSRGHVEKLQLNLNYEPDDPFPDPSREECLDYAVDWDGPSKFKTDATNFQLQLGQGAMTSEIQILTGPVLKPTLSITGKVSPMPKGSDQEELPLIKHESVELDMGMYRDRDISISKLGLHITLMETGDQLDVSIWHEGRRVQEDKGAEELTAGKCASLNIVFTLPEHHSFKRYGSVVVMGEVANVNAHGLENIEFESLVLSTAVGDVVCKGDVFADEFFANVRVGKADIESVQATTNDESARAGKKKNKGQSRKPLDVKVETYIGRANVGVKTSLVDKDVSKPHRVSVKAQTGSINLQVAAPSSASSFSTSSHQKPGDLQVETSTNSGGIKNTIQLTNTHQTLILDSKSVTGAVNTFVSDAYVGRFDLKAVLGSTIVKSAPGSDSKIVFEKQIGQYKTGYKTLGDEDEDRDENEDEEARISLRAITGRVALEFTK
ncbi:hypothetical protein EDD11_010142 [Mortierella claussenii]|nr:hypothetical protein EDD11_010142 [Mortierella claussenii]